MDVKLTPKKEKSQVELSITVPAEDFKPYIERAARKLSKERPLTGFRPGKAPVSVVVEALGQERVLREAFDLALSRFFVEVVLENKIEAINRPSITVEELSLEGPFRFTAIVDVLPEVKVGDPKKITLGKRTLTVSEEEVEKELQYLAKMRSSYIDVPRPAQTGDTVTVDFEVTMNGQLMEGGESKNHPIQLGEGYFVPDFEKNLSGMSTGEERTFSIEFPPDFGKEDFRGKRADVHVKAHGVQKRILPALDDEFAKKLGKFTNVQQLKDELKKNIREEKEGKETERWRGELMEKLAELSEFGYIPEILIEKEIDQRLQEFAQMLGYQQKTVDDYLNQSKKTLADIRNEMRETAIKGVKIALAVRAFGEQERVTISEEELEEKSKEYLQRFNSLETAKKEIDPQELKENIETTLRNQKIIARLEEMVTSLGS